MLLVLGMLMMSMAVEPEVPPDRPGERAEKVPEPSTAVLPASAMPPLRAVKPLASAVVEEEETEDTDSVSSGPVAFVLDRYRGQLQYCYEKNLRARPGLQGRVVLQWDVVDESAERVRLVSSTVDHVPFEDCLRHRVMMWSYTGVEDQEVRQVFVFTASGMQ